MKRIMKMFDDSVLWTDGETAYWIDAESGDNECLGPIHVYYPDDIDEEKLRHVIDVCEDLPKQWGIQALLKEYFVIQHGQDILIGIYDDVELVLIHEGREGEPNPFDGTTYPDEMVKALYHIATPETGEE